MNLRSTRLLALLILFLGSISAGVQANDQVAVQLDIAPPATDSPRSTITSLFSEVERAFRDRARSDRLNLDALLTLRPLQLIDLEKIPRELRADVGVETILKLYEILRRVDLPPFDEIPDNATVVAGNLKSWRVPGTDIALVDSVDESQVAHFRFAADTVEIVRHDYPLIEGVRPHRGELRDDAFVMFRDGVGPILTRLLREIGGLMEPPPTGIAILGVPAWKLGVTLALHALALAIAASVYLLVGRVERGVEVTIRGTLRRMLLPLTVMVLAAGLQVSVDRELRITGPVLEVLDVFWVSMFSVGMILFGFVGMRFCAEVFVKIASLRDKPGDSQAVRLVFRVLALLICLAVVVIALQRLGVPVSGIVTGLGVGGLAVALAAQGMLKNLLGGAALLADRPVKIGDFCSFGERMGTLETIGLRSSRIRSLDRTLVTVPNSDLADMQIENFNKRDVFLWQSVIGVRYETTPDQLRAILADIRALLIAHPSVSPDPARARFGAFGDSALNIELFAYIRADNWNTHLAVREDLLLRIMDIIERNGSAVAFPSRTLYLRRDDNPDTEARQKAEAKVARWRHEGTLPFPEMDGPTAGELLNTLDYPPQGSAVRETGRE